MKVIFAGSALLCMLVYPCISSARSLDALQEKQFFLHLEKALKNSDSTQLALMKAEIEALNSEGQSVFLKTSDVPKRESIFLTCLTGKGAAIAAGRIGFCIDGRGQFHNLIGVGAGFSFTLSGSLIFGIVRSSNDDVSDVYSSLSGGLSNGEELLKGLLSLKAGFGVDAIIGSSRNKTLILIGPALGVGLDLSKVEIRID